MDRYNWRDSRVNFRNGLIQELKQRFGNVSFLCVGFSFNQSPSIMELASTGLGLFPHCLDTSTVRPRKAGRTL